MAEEDIPKALSVFGQVHRRQSLEGTGLGLPLCKVFAELHGGTLDLTSVLGEGTTVTITFPENRVLNKSQVATASFQNTGTPVFSAIPPDGEKEEETVAES